MGENEADVVGDKEVKAQGEETTAGDVPEVDVIVKDVEVQGEEATAGPCLGQM